MLLVLIASIVITVVGLELVLHFTGYNNLRQEVKKQHRAQREL